MWLALMEGEEAHDADWHPTNDFVDKDETMTAMFREYIIKHDFIPEL